MALKLFSGNDAYADGNKKRLSMREDNDGNYVEMTSKNSLTVTAENAIPPSYHPSDDENGEAEPELTARTYIALTAMFLLNLVQVVALQGPPVVLPYIGMSLNDPTKATWVVNSLSLVQAVLGPIVASASDVFQARKNLLVGFSVVSMIGCAICPGAKSIDRLIAGQSMIGVGFATVPLAYSVPSEIIPRKYRPMAQSLNNVAATLGAIIGPLSIGALTSNNLLNGWRDFYWMQMGIWAFTIVCMIVGYHPPKRQNGLEHLKWWQKLLKLDIVGTLLLTIGLTLFLVGLSMGGAQFPWDSSRVLSTMVVGLGVLIGFGIHQWKGTKTGLLHHGLFGKGKERGQTFSICVCLMLVEGIMLFSFVIFFPQLTAQLYESRPLQQAARTLPYWVINGMGTVLYGWLSSRFRTIKPIMMVGFAIMTGAAVGFATLEPSDSTRSMIFAALMGLGFAAPLILIVSGVQLSTPHSLISTATAVTTSARAIAATVFTAIYTAAVGDRATKYVPGYVGKAAIGAGLPADSVGPFIAALTGSVPDAVAKVRGVTPAIIAAGTAALKQANADSIRVVYIIAAPFGLLAIVLCLFVGDMRKTMNMHIDAPVERVEAKNSSTNTA